MSYPRPPVDVNLKDLKARKGHVCLGGLWGDGQNPVCGCGALLRAQPDFMDLPRADQRTWSAPQGQDSLRVARGPVDYPNVEPPLVSGDGSPPAPFHHASGEPCYGCQSCFANADVDYDEPDGSEVDVAVVAYRPGDPMDEADVVESVGRDAIVRHDAPDMAPSVPLVDPTMPYGPAEVERALLDANRRLELGSKHEANLIAATEQLKIEYELRYAKAIEMSTGGAADIRKANAVLASEREYRAWHDAMAARDAMKAVTHSLRSTVSALQSVSRSVGASYTGPHGRGQ